MRTITVIATLGALLLLCGCAEQWRKPGASALDFEAMKASCGDRAYSRFPPRPRQVLVSHGYTTPRHEACTAGGCFQIGGDYVPPVVEIVDDNGGAREQAVRACFFEQGWRPARS